MSVTVEQNDSLSWGIIAVLVILFIASFLALFLYASPVAGL